jgi:cobalt-zinc-cadmium efflux system protein
VSGFERGKAKGRLAAVLGLTAVVFGVEVAGGIASGSLSLLGDAGHMLTDATAILVSLLALRLAEMAADHRRTFGYARFEILAALGNGALLIALGGALALEAVRRIGSPRPIATGIVLAVAGVGLLANVVSASLLHGGHDDLNLHGAYLHVLADTVSSGAVLVAALAIRLGAPVWCDAAVTLLLVVLLVVSATRLIVRSVAVLLESAPPGIDLEALRQRILGLPGVRDLHDLHVWSITSDQAALSGHLLIDGTLSAGEVLRAAERLLSDEFGLTHTTLQLEGVDYDSCSAPHA